MKVSIIIPIYNVADYIERCIRSVISQTYNGELECILVDDCSTDDSMKKCNEIVDSYEGPVKFYILHHEHNRGLSSARNTGTDFCTGEYLFYLDSDDELTPDAISLLVKETVNHPGVEMVQGSTVSVPDNAYYHTVRYIGDSCFSSNQRIRLENYRPKKYIPCTAWNKLVKAEFIKTNNIRFCEGLIHEDQYWMYTVTKKLSSLVFVFEPTYIYYLRPNSIMSTNIQGQSPKSRESWLKIIETTLDNLDDIYRENQLLRYCFELICRPTFHCNKGRRLLLRYCKEFIMYGHFSLVFLILASMLCGQTSRFKYKACNKIKDLSDKVYDENLKALTAQHAESK